MTADAIPLHLSERGSAWLSAVADGLARGELELWQLPAGARELFITGYDLGRESLAPELRRAADDAATYYELLHAPTPAARAALVHSRIERALHAAEHAGELQPGPALVALVVAAAEPPPAPPAMLTSGGATQ